MLDFVFKLFTKIWCSTQSQIDPILLQVVETVLEWFFTLTVLSRLWKIDQLFLRPEPKSLSDQIHSQLHSLSEWRPHLQPCIRLEINLRMKSMQEALSTVKQKERMLRKYGIILRRPLEIDHHTTMVAWNSEEQITSSTLLSLDFPTRWNSTYLILQVLMQDTNLMINVFDKM